MLHRVEDCTGMHTNLNIKDGIGGSVGSRSDTMKQYKRSENKLKKYLEALKKRNKILYSIANKYVSRRKINKIKKIKKMRKKSSKKGNYSSSDN